MNFKVFAAFFIALLAVHASSQTPIKDDGIKDILVVVLNKVLEVTESALKKASGLVDELETDQEKIKDHLVEVVVKEEVKLNERLVALIDRLKDGATDNGKAVLQCIDAEQSSTDAAFAKGAGQVGDCLVGEVKVIVPELKTIVGQLNDLQDDVQGQVSSLAACSDGELPCLVKFITSAVDTIKKIPPVVKEDVAAIKQLVETVVSDVHQCGLLPSILSDVQVVFNEAVECIKG